MLAFSEYRRSSPSLSEIRPGMGASRSAVRRLEDRCEEVGIKMTDLRRILLHGILEAGPRATAVEIWKTLGKMMEDGHAPSQGSIQRNLNLLVERGILRRDVTPDRQWLYSVAPERKAALAITFVEAGTGRKIACNAPEVATVLRRVAAEHGLAVQAAAITVTSSAGHDLEAR
ncbi:Fur family transcriptional regulator [Komagataeibacter rhaeticus]|nr:Fur family transcriptional regulator [Komagataeibacter rhaeticus]